MNSLKSLIMMISIYTRIPMPALDWEEKSMKHVLLFLPAAGLLVGGTEVLWLLPFAWLSLSVSSWLYAVAACIIPVILTGGIHMDGLADSADALASWGSTEKKREILRDPHIGTFGVLALIIYMMLQFVLFMLFFEKTVIFTNNLLPFQRPAMLLASVFVLSRALTQIAAAWIPPSAEEGMLYRFSSLTNRRMLGATGFILIAAGQGLWYCFGGYPALLLFPCLVLHLLLFRRMALRNFGGISGDLCGRLIQLSELWMTGLLCAVMIWETLAVSPAEVFGWFS